MIQLPLPSHYDETVITAAVPPHKDIDGLHPSNLGRLAQTVSNDSTVSTDLYHSFEGSQFFVPASTLAIMSLLDHHEVHLEGTKVVVLGLSRLVGSAIDLA